jgi:hypothetical protein
VPSNPGGLNTSECCSLENNLRTEVVLRDFCSLPTSLGNGKGDVPWEETSMCTMGSAGMCTMGSAGVRVQAPGDSFAEVTPGRTSFQPGRTATCKDSGHQGNTEAVRGLRSGA